MASFRVSTYEDAKTQLRNFLGLIPIYPIYLLGTGANGKTHLTNELQVDIESANRDVYEINSHSEIHSPAYVIDMNNIKYT
tara:strand:+ start:1376 stop:1618 length:243 start_codon:yes stop_codon:yes gene_type:complete